VRVNQRLTALLAAGGGVLTWAEATRELPPHIVRYALRTGRLARPFPGVLAAPDRAADPAVRRRAALRLAGPDAALSHLSALVVWGLPTDDREGIHLVTGLSRRIRIAGIVAHRRHHPIESVTRNGFPVTRLERALVEAWPLRHADAQRAPLLAAIANRWTTAERVSAALDAVRNLPDRRTLTTLLSKLSAGCQSELELWGYDRVFTGPDMPSFARQVPVRLPGRTVYLDLLDRETRTDFELDGAKWHSGPAERERDLRRDAALAARGFRVVRFTHDRLIGEPETVRAEVLAVLATARLGRLAAG
jgi:very-short-patch-repair endonuclease